MAPEQSLFLPGSSRRLFQGVARRSVASYEQELAEHRALETRLRQLVEKEEAVIQEKDQLLHRQELLGREADHRLLNGLQMIVSLLSLQSRTAANPDAAAHLSVAAGRVAAMARVHKHLHSPDGAGSIAFKAYLRGLCREYSEILVATEAHGQAIVVDGVESEIPTAKAVPLGLIVNELITNAAKHGHGAIMVRLQANPEGGHVLSVCNEGPPLPPTFDPSACQGLGMKIVSALLEQIGGKLSIETCSECRGTRFSVSFS